VGRVARSGRSQETRDWSPAPGEAPQAAGTDGSEVSDFFEDHALQRIFEDAWIEQIAYLNARPALDQHGAEKTQRVFVPVEIRRPFLFYAFEGSSLRVSRSYFMPGR